MRPKAKIGQVKKLPTGACQCVELCICLERCFTERVRSFEYWCSNNSAQRCHRWAKPRQTVLFSGERLNLAMTSHSAANLTNRSDVFIGGPLALRGPLMNRIADSLKGSR